MTRKILLKLYLLCFFSVPVLSKEIDLFSSRSESEYARKVQSIEFDDILILRMDNDPRRYKVRIDRVLDQGSQTRVFKVHALFENNFRGPLALRVLYQLRVDACLFMNGWIDGQQQLRGLGLRVPTLYMYSPAQFALVEYIEVDFLLNDFLSGRADASPSSLLRTEKALYRWAKTTRGFHRISDFKFRQLAYDSKNEEWILLDFADDSVYAPNAPPRVRFENDLGFPYQAFSFPETADQIQYKRRKRISENVIKVYEGLDPTRVHTYYTATGCSSGLVFLFHHGQNRDNPVCKNSEK